MKAICPLRLATILRSKRNAPCVSTQTNEKTAYPPSFGATREQEQGKKTCFPRGKGAKTKAKIEAKIHGCLIDPQNGATVFWPFWDENKLIFALLVRGMKNNVRTTFSQVSWK